MATTPDGLLLQLASWHKEGLQRLTAVVDKHKASLAVLIQLAEADIVELVAPFAEAEKPRNKRRTGAKQQQQKVVQLQQMEQLIIRQVRWLNIKWINL